MILCETDQFIFLIKQFLTFDLALLFDICSETIICLLLSPFMPHIKSIIYLFFIIFLASCSGYEKVLKSDDINYKLSKANEYFDKKQYLKANTLYEGMLQVLKGTKNFESLYFNYSYTSFYLKDYLSASFHFKNFIDYFPGSKDVEEAEFMHAVSLFKLAPKATLEQTNTVKAMEAMQSYLNRHPDSKRIEEANKMIDEMRLKLEQKEASAAKLYFNIGQYKAATIAFKSVMQNYPESNANDLYQYMIIQANFQFAKASVLEKQEERFINTINAYNELKETYPKSKYVFEAEKIVLLVNDYLKNIKNEHQ